MLPQAQTHAALVDVSHGRALPEEILDYFIGRGFVERVKAGTDIAAGADDSAAELRLTEAGKACLHDGGV
jgi:hypothetical protein